MTHRPGTSASTTSNVKASCAPIQTSGQTRPSTLIEVSIGRRASSLIPRQVALDKEEAASDGGRPLRAAREVRRLSRWRQPDSAQGPTHCDRRMISTPSAMTDAPNETTCVLRPTMGDSLVMRAHRRGLDVSRAIVAGPRSGVAAVDRASGGGV